MKEMVTGVGIKEGKEGGGGRREGGGWAREPGREVRRDVWIITTPPRLIEAYLFVLHFVPITSHLLSAPSFTLLFLFTPFSPFSKQSPVTLFSSCFLSPFSEFVSVYNFSPFLFHFLCFSTTKKKVKG